MNSVIRMLFDSAGIGGNDEKEVIEGLIRDNEEYATDFICGLGLIGEKEREVLEVEYPNLFSLETV